MKFPNLSWAMREQHVTQFELGQKIGITQGTVSLRMLGRIKFSHEEQKKIAEILGYPEAWLFEEVTAPKSTQG